MLTTQIDFTAEYANQLAIQLEQTSSRIAKQVIIQRELRAHRGLGRLFYLALADDFATFVGDAIYTQLSNSLQTTTTGSLTLDQSWDMFEILHKGLVEQTITGDEKVAILLNFLSTCDKPTAILYLKLFAQKLFVGVAARIVNNAVGYELVPIWGVQLCGTYSPSNTYAGVDSWWVSPKINGMRGTYKNGQLYSRSGKRWSGPGFNGICKELRELQNSTQFNLFDGELFSVDKRLSFQNLSSLLRASGDVAEASRIGARQQIIFLIFAGVNTGLPNYGVADTADMYFKLQHGFDAAAAGWRYLKLLTQITIANKPSKILDACKLFTSDGYEGIVLRHPTIAFNQKRSNHLLKYKLFKEADLTVVGYEIGGGKYAGMLGSLICEGTVEGEKVYTKCGSGFSDEQRADMWRNKDALVGRTVNIKYQALTDANFLGTCSFAFPVFMSLKEKEIAP